MPDLTQQKIEELSDRVKQDPLLLQKLTDRVYRLMQSEAENQRDRQGNSRRLK
ncbi:MAG: hypothetical protein J7647_26875 [Cyanobacteria bacterium SBLK]|nr:hypothetical protein [Cyanobacteria bacterium SBLK]